MQCRRVCCVDRNVMPSDFSLYEDLLHLYSGRRKGLEDFKI